MNKVKILYLIFLLLCAQSALGQVVNSETSLDQAENLYNKALSYDITNLDSANVFRNTLKASIDLYENSDITKNHAYAYILLAKSYYRDNKIDSAIISAQNALKYYPSNPSAQDIQNRTDASTYLSSLYIAQGEHEMAENSIINLLDHALKHNDMKTFVRYNYFLGGVYDNMGRTEQALKHYAISVENAISLNDYDMACAGQMAIATDYNKQGRFEDAVTASQLTIKYAELNNNNELQIGSGWHILASAYYSMKKYDDAIKVLEKAAEHYTKANETKLREVVQNSITYILSETGQKEKAVEQIKSKEAAANDSYVGVDTLSEPMKNSYESMKLEKMLAEYNSADKQRKFETLQSDYLVHQAEILRQRVWFIGGLSLLAVISLLLLYARQRQKTMAERAARDAEEKQREYLALQQQTETRMIKEYLNGLESERERISKELHDGICNDLLAIEIEMKNTGVDTDRAELLNRCRESVRNISHDLLPPQFQYASIYEILSDYCGRLSSKQTTVSYKTDKNSNLPNISEEVSFAIYRIVQEAVSNSIKHSGATKIDIMLSGLDNNRICVEVSDNGTGFNPGVKGKGVGSVSMHERAKSVDGDLSVDTNPEGTTIKATFNI